MIPGQIPILASATCGVCERLMLGRPSALGLFCGHHCRAKASMKPRAVTCTLCHKSIVRRPKDLSRGRLPFCSRECLWLSRSSLVASVLCDACGVLVVGKPGDVYRNRSCSTECARSLRSKAKEMTIDLLGVKITHRDAAFIAGISPGSIQGRKRKGAPLIRQRQRRPRRGQ